MRRSNRIGQTGFTGYDVRFGPQPTLSGSILQIAAFGSGSATFAWEESVYVWTTGTIAPTLTHIVLVPSLGTTSYIGVDDMVLAPVGAFYSYPQAVGNSHSLSGAGAVQGGSALTLGAISNSPGSICVLLAGTESLCTPVLGQLLTVAPILTDWALTDSLGAASFAFTWPLGVPQGIRAYFQTWIIEPNGNYSASNGLAAIGA
jgi:hypothetical protein